MAPLVWVTRATNTVSVEVTNSETIQRGAIRPPLKLLLLVACISGMSIIFSTDRPETEVERDPIRLEQVGRRMFWTWPSVADSMPDYLA